MTYTSAKTFSVPLSLLKKYDSDLNYEYQLTADM